MIDSDHERLKQFIGDLSTLRKRRSELKGVVEKLVSVQREVQVQERAQAEQLRTKALYIAELKKSKELKLSELKGLRDGHRDLGDEMAYAFFERRGQLHAPVDGRTLRNFGNYSDTQFRFKLSQKGQVYATERGASVKSVYGGRVTFARALPGYGKTVIVDHGDNYYSVYAF